MAEQSRGEDLTVLKCFTSIRGEKDCQLFSVDVKMFL